MSDPANHDIRYCVGDTILYGLTLRIRDADDNVSAIDLTGGSVAFWYNNSGWSSLAAVLSDPANGQITIDIGSLSLAAGNYNYYVVITYSDGKEHTHTRGRLLMEERGDV